MSRMIIGRWSIVGVLATLSIGCIPSPDNAGGTIPPPQIDDNVPPGFDGGGGGGGDPPPVGQTTFDVTIDASSLMIGGITVEAVLTLNTVAGGNVEVTRFSLADTVNETGATFGFSGGISLVSSAGGTDFFTISNTGNGRVSATIRPTSSSGDESNLFIVQEGSGAFNPGAMGLGHSVQAGSLVTFSIDGNNVTGTLDLTGTPINSAGGTEVYVGTFSGTRRGS